LYARRDREPVKGSAFEAKLEAIDAVAFLAAAEKVAEADAASDEFDEDDEEEDDDEDEDGAL
jgi:hypothetical protein